jgi:nucleoside 2-deoxyribosyltransferase
MNIYLASRYSRKGEMIKHKRALERAGHKCTSRWLDGDDEESAAIAERDVQDVSACDILVLFLEVPRVASRGGRMVECGLALGLNKIVLAVGTDIENIFLHLPYIQRFNTWPDCLAHLGKHGGDRRSAAVKNQVHNTHLKPAKRDRATIARRAA